MALSAARMVLLMNLCVSLPGRLQAKHPYLDCYKSLSSQCLMCLEVYDAEIMKMKIEQYCSSQCCTEDITILDAKAHILLICFLLPLCFCKGVGTHVASSAARSIKRHQSSDKKLCSSDNQVALGAQDLCTELYSKFGQSEKEDVFLKRKPDETPVKTAINGAAVNVHNDSLTTQESTYEQEENKEGDRHSNTLLSDNKPITDDSMKTEVNNDHLTDNSTTENKEEGGAYRIAAVPNKFDGMREMETDILYRRKRPVVCSMEMARDSHLHEIPNTIMETKHSEMYIDIPTDSVEGTAFFQDLKKLKQYRRIAGVSLNINGIQTQPRRIESTKNYKMNFSRSARPVEFTDALAFSTPASDRNVYGISTKKSKSQNRKEMNLKRPNFRMKCVTHLSECIDHFKTEKRLQLFKLLNDIQVNQFVNPCIKKKKTEKEMDMDEFDALRNVTWLPPHRLPVPKIELTVALVGGEIRDVLDSIAAGKQVRPQESMKYELLRICTFRNYPSENKPFKIQLASAGFYYASERDEVVCYTCGLRKSGWVESDKPFEIHIQIKRSCEFLIKNDHVNVPIPDLPPENQSKFSALEALINSTDSIRMEENQRSGEASGIYSNLDLSTSTSLPYRVFTSPPKHPQYALMSIRLETFKSWPPNIPQTAQVMAECGYYYAGFGDCVRCFHCGIGLRHWTEDDYPWTEHARWSKDCAYLRQMKGEEFIQRVHLDIDQDDEPEDLRPVTPKGQPADVSQVTPNEDINQILLTNPAQSVLEIGYSPNTVKTAIGMVLRSEGRSGITAQKILEKVFILEENTDDLSQEVANMAISSAVNDETQLSETSNKQRKENETKLPKSGADQKPQSNFLGRNSEEIRANNLSSNDPLRDTRIIIAENRKLKEQTVCKVCLDKPVSIVFLPCGHLVTCANCAPAMKKCPICRAVVKGCVKTCMS